MKPNRPLLLVLLTSLCFLAVSCLPGDDASGDLPSAFRSGTVFGAAEDATVANDEPTKSLGYGPSIDVVGQGFVIRRGLVRVEIEGAGAPEDLVSARLEVDIQGFAQGFGPGTPLDLHRVTSTWTEHGATWECTNDDDLGGVMNWCDPAMRWDMWDFASLANPVPTDTQWVVEGQTGVLSFDVTGDVAGILAGAVPNDGWLLKLNNEWTGARLALGSAQSANGPRLVLDFVGGGETDGDPPPAVESYCTGSPSRPAMKATAIHRHRSPISLGRRVLRGRLHTKTVAPNEKNFDRNVVNQRYTCFVAQLAQARRLPTEIRAS